MKKNKLVIGLSGPSNSGKTTIAKSLIKKYNLYDNTDFVTKHFIPKYGFPEYTKDSQLQVTKTWGSVIDSCQRAQIIDRTPLDHLIYARLFNTLSPELLTTTWENLQKVNLLIICPAVVWIKGDKHRHSKEVQKRFQQQLEWFIKDHDCTYTGWRIQRGLLSNASKKVLYTMPPKDCNIEELLKFASHEVWSYCKVNNILLEEI